MTNRQGEETELGARRFPWLRVGGHRGAGGGRGGAESNRFEAQRNGSQLRVCMITLKTSFASGNEIQTHAQ